MTLKEIAEELNVSPSTVSRVLNGCSKNFTVKPELRARILDQVERSGYKPNRVFSSLRSKERLSRHGGKVPVFSPAVFRQWKGSGVKHLPFS